jgi:tetratricopeptide (TPR) repeat protein
MATEYAISGDSARAEETVNAAIDAGASPDWEPIIKGVESLYSRRSMKAVEHLQELVESDPDNVAALGVLAAAHLYTGGIDECVAVMKQLRKSEPREDYEYLFRGYPEIYEDSVAAEKYLRLAVRNRNAWPLAHAMLAEALAMRCLDEPIDEDAMEFAREAIRYSEKTRMVLGSNPYVISINLHVYHVAIRRADKNDPQFSEWEAAAAAAARKLEPFDQFIIGRWIRGAYYDFIGQPDMAESDYHSAVEAGAGPIYESYYDAFLFKLGRTEEAFRTGGTVTSHLAIADLPNARAIATSYLAHNT